MGRQKNGEGRGLDYFEVALIKRMIIDEFPRDRILSFFVRPGRVISPAVKSEIERGKIGKEIEPATVAELERFVAARLNEVRPIGDQTYGGPLSPSRVREVLSLAEDAQRSLPGFESQIFEYKEIIPVDRSGRIKTAKVAASFANSRGGYVFFGINDHRRVKGIDPGTGLDKHWQEISQCVSDCFTPHFRWDHAEIPIGDKVVAAMYVYEFHPKPVICVRDYGSEIHKGQVYARYSAITKLIEPGDLISMLGERDQRTIASALSAKEEPTQPQPLEPASVLLA